MNKDEEKRMKEKIDFFKHNEIKVHVELTDRTFLNGIIIKELDKNVYWIIDDKLGGVYLFLRDIYNIDKFKEKENERN